MHNLMSSRISTIQALIGSHATNAHVYTDLLNPDFRAVMENVSSTTKSDITLYTPDGKVFYSSTPEVFDKMILGNRIDQKAFHNIRHLHQRFFINKEKLADFGYWVLYAPIMNGDKEIVAILSSPYTEGDYDFRREAFFHAALLINLFLLLLIARSLLGRGRESTVRGTWDCGYAAPDARMEYTGTAFAQPLSDFLHRFTGWRKQVQPPQGYFPQTASIRITTADPATAWFWVPVFRWFGTAAVKIRVLQSGFLHFYILLMTAALILMLAWGFFLCGNTEKSGKTPADTARKEAVK